MDLELTGKGPRGLASGEARGAGVGALRRANTGRPPGPGPAR